MSILQWEPHNMSYEKVFEIIKMGYLERINVIDYVAKARETSNSRHRLRANGELKEGKFKQINVMINP